MNASVARARTLVGALLTQAAGTASLVLLSTASGSLAVLLAGIGITGFGHISSVVAFRSIAVSRLPDHEQESRPPPSNRDRHPASRSRLGSGDLRSVVLARSDALRGAGTTAEDALAGGNHYAVATGAALLGVAPFFASFALQQPARRRIDSTAI